jgi:hypothetical protein
MVPLTLGFVVYIGIVIGEGDLDFFIAKSAMAD